MRDVPALVRALTFVEVVRAAPGEVEATLPFTEGSRAVLTWSPGDYTAFTFRAVLPDTEAGRSRAHLSPQRGVIAHVEALREIKLDDALVDDAFVIHGDDPALLLAVVPELRALAPLAPTIAIAEALVVTFARLAENDVDAAVSGAFGLWHRAVFFQLAAR